MQQLGDEIVRLQLKFQISINPFTNSVVMKVSNNQNSDGNIHYASYTVEITHSLVVSYLLSAATLRCIL